MPAPHSLVLEVPPDGVTFSPPAWPGLRLGPGRPALRLGDREQPLRLAAREALPAGGWRLTWAAPGGHAQLVQDLTPLAPAGWRVHSVLHYAGPTPTTLAHVVLWRACAPRGSALALGDDAARTRILENNQYAGQVRSLGQLLSGVDGRRALNGQPGMFHSQTVTVFDHRAHGAALLIGFTSFARFLGLIEGRSRAASARRAGKTAANVDPSAAGAAFLHLRPPALPAKAGLAELQLLLAGGGIRLEPGAVVELEDCELHAGPDPFDLLDAYADATARRYPVRGMPAPFANWCSWYPYRLRVSEERVLATARAAAARHLPELGLRFVQVDLGWERDNVPSYFEENERFAHGLKWLADQLRAHGVRLGVWQGLGCVSAQHPVAREHPDWLVRGADGQPRSTGKWYWEPHDEIYALDITHPDAFAWLRTQVESLAARGAEYLKWDFGGIVVCDGQRHDAAVAVSGTLEGMRRTSAMVRTAMRDALVLDCTCMETANLGHFPMLYTNMDTGNTGLGFQHLRTVLGSAATHLFKNRRWGLLQPSCLVVGLPGTLEEARLRATIAFLFGGHMDISDNLCTLPEDRWQVLTAVMPPIPTRTRVPDLFHPLRIGPCGAWMPGNSPTAVGAWTDEPQGPLLWSTPLAADWDEWQLVAVCHFFAGNDSGAVRSDWLRFAVDFAALGLDPAGEYWAYEFWSGQFLGTLPVPPRPADDYRHPGDAALLLNDAGPGRLDLSFVGPAVKLLVLRRPRPHPWPVGTSFHASGGQELADVTWDAATRTLRGTLRRPPGQQGFIAFAALPTVALPGASAGDSVARAMARATDTARLAATVGGVPVALRAGAPGSALLPITTAADATAWTLTLTDPHGKAVNP